MVDQPPIATIDYTNYKGERATRAIRPLKIKYGTTPYHVKPQWLLDAIDLEKGFRTFALKDIHAWL